MIGIADGMGPYAGADFFRKILDNTLAESDQEHLDIVLFSTPRAIHDRTEFLTGSIKTNPAYAIVKVLLNLEKAGANFVGIPCNTAHSEQIFSVIKSELIKAESKIQLLSLINETISHIKEEFGEVKNVGILSTTGSYRFKLYSAPLLKNGFHVTRVTSEMQNNLIHPAIYHHKYGIKSKSDPVTPRAKENLLQGAAYLKENGAEIIILGCTEIPLAITEKEVFGLPVIDPVTILARKLIQLEAPNKLKPL